jgi:predicted ATP-grasp superfamily ATP-dependent carboligase
MPTGADILMKILLTDGHQRSALAVTRSIGRAGMEVWVGESEEKNLSASSKYCRKAIVYPSPYEDEEGFLETIKNLVGKEKLDMVIPISDITSAILSENKKELERFTTVATADPEIYWAASDKNNLHRLAEELGVPTPALYYIEKPQQISDFLGKISFPCVLKPARSRLRLSGRWIPTSVKRIKSKDDLIKFLQEDSGKTGPFMIQKEIHGEGQGVFALCDRGEPKAWFAHRRLREKPPWGGVSTLRESVALDPQLKEYAERLLRRLRWHGVAMVEFKRETGTGVPYLMEINGRFWGSLQLAIDAGIDFPLLLVQLYKGDTVRPQSDYRVGIRSRWFLGDVDHLLGRLSRRGRSTPDAPSIGALLMDFMKFNRKDTYYEVESWSDPGPSLYEITRYLSEGVKGLMDSIRGTRHGG